MKIITNIILASLGVIVASFIVEGVNVGFEPWFACVIVAGVLGLINTFIRPVIKFFSIPLNVITLGLFTLVINGGMVLLCDHILPDNIFSVDGFLSALGFSIVLWIVNWLLSFMFKDKE